MKAIFTATLMILLGHLAVAAEPAKPKLGELPVSRILYLGNSITLHAPAPHIGWTGNWGMAASAKEKDYVHLLTADIAKTAKTQPETMVRNIADFERGHAMYDIAEQLKPELDFHADLIILAIGENVAESASDESRDTYRAAFSKLIDELKSHGSPTIFVRSSFWPNPAKDEIMRDVAEKAGATFVDISKLGRDEVNAARAERKFEHDGVAGHPGDKGMRAIADALFADIKKRSTQAGK